MKQTPLAQRWLEIALERDPRQPDTHETLARFFEAAGETALAELHRQTARRLRSSTLKPGEEGRRGAATDSKDEDTWICRNQFCLAARNPDFLMSSAFSGAILSGGPKN